MKAYPKIMLVTIIATVCFALTLCVVNAFHHPSGAGMANDAVPAFISDFLPNRDPVPAALAGAGRIISTMDLQRELNRLFPELKLKVDGVYGPLTQAAHERACGDQYARATWPSDELVAREVE